MLIFLLVAHPALEHEKCNGGFKADWTTNGTFLISTFVRHPHLSESWSRVQRYADTFYWSSKKRIPSHTDHLPWWLFVLGVSGAFPKPSPALQPVGSCCGSLGWEHSAWIQEIMLTPTPPKTPPLLGFVCQFRLTLVQILQPPLYGWNCAIPWKRGCTMGRSPKSDQDSPGL